MNHIRALKIRLTPDDNMTKTGLVVDVTLDISRYGRGETQTFNKREWLPRDDFRSIYDRLFDSIKHMIKNAIEEGDAFADES